MPYPAAESNRKEGELPSLAHVTLKEDAEWYSWFSDRSGRRKGVWIWAVSGRRSLLATSGDRRLGRRWRTMESGTYKEERRRIGKNAVEIY